MRLNLLRRGNINRSYEFRELGLLEVGLIMSKLKNGIGNVILWLVNGLRGHSER